MILNIRECLNKIDLATDNKYDLLNTFNCNNISNDKKKKLAEALNKNASAKTISRMLNESYDKYGYLKESLTESSYGGVYDIEDDMFFTKEEIVEFVEEICTYLEDIFGYQYNINNVYIDGPRKLYINIYDNNYIEVESTFDIDMRKIRKPSDLSKVYGLTIENWFQKAFAREYKDAGLDESLTEDKKVGSNELSNRRGLPKDNWKLVKVTDGVVSYKGTIECDIYSRELDNNYSLYDYYQGEVIFDDYGINDPQLIQDVFPDVGTKVKLAIYRVPKNDPDHHWTGDYFVDYIDETNESLTEDTVKTKSGKWVNKGDTGKAHGEFKTKKAADAQRRAMFQNGYKAESLDEARIVEPKYRDGDVVFVGDADGYHGTFLIKGDFRNIPEELYHNIRRITKYGNLDKPYYKVEYKIDSNHLFEEDYREFFEYIIPILKDAGIDVLKSEKDIEYNESLKEAIDDGIDLDYETDFDDGEVEEGNTFIEDGRTWSWIERIAGPIHLDFDNWSVWSARDWDYIEEKVKPLLVNKEEFNVEVLTKIYDEAEVAYFVVEEDTGFIDWGPVETSTEAQDFLNGKVEDYENDEEHEEIEIEEESLTESRAIRNDGDYEVTLHYDDIGDGKEYDYKLGYDEVVDYLREIAWSNGDGPEDANEDEYLEWVMDNFDELADKYELNVLNYFESEASQYEYDHRNDEP